MALVISSAVEVTRSAELWISPLASSMALASISAEFLLCSEASCSSCMISSIGDRAAESVVSVSVCWAWLL